MVLLHLAPAIIAELTESASVLHCPASLVLIICRPVGAVSYEAVTEEGLKRDVLFCYDLELPADFQPTAQVNKPLLRHPQVFLVGAAVIERSHGDSDRAGEWSVTDRNAAHGSMHPFPAAAWPGNVPMTV